MKIAKIILFIVTINSIWVKTESSKPIQIPCTKDDHCSAFMGDGVVCRDSECICEDVKKCNATHKPEGRVKATIIGEDCADDFNCNIQHAFCSDGFCTCKKDRVPSKNNRKCLKVAGGLGQSCEEDVQCVRSSSGSICRDNVCECDDKYHRVNFECHEKVGLDQSCEKDSECSHIANSHCDLILCKCNVGFVKSSSKDKCLPIASNKDDSCEDVEQCRHLYGFAATCLYGKCECDGIHRLTNTTCPSRLKNHCESDSDCKNYSDDPTMHCDQGRCECLSPYVEQGGICNGSARFTSLSVMWASMLILILCFK